MALFARIVQPSSPSRSGEFSMHFTGGRASLMFASLLLRVDEQEEINKENIMRIKLSDLIGLYFLGVCSINV